MRVRELMTGALITVAPDMPVLEARHLVVEQRIRHLLSARPQLARIFHP
jgi:hypothetical protein